jgi:hypothetical protein
VVNGYVFTNFGEQITADSCTSFDSSYGSGYNTGYITNSIFTGVTGGTNFTSFDHSVWKTTSTGIYQPLGAASYYLASGSPYQNAGTMTIDAPTLADLQNMTTYPPTVVTSIANNVTFSPVALRNTGAPDYGYHYDPIDVAIMAADPGYSITVLPGTALATYGSVNDYGIWLDAGATMNCQGTATSPNYIVRYNTVQEQSTTVWPVVGSGGSFGGPAILFYPNSGPETAFLYCRFTTWSVPAGGVHFYADETSVIDSFALQDCQIFSGTITNYGPSLWFTNNLFHRVSLEIGNNRHGVTPTNYFFNNLFLGGGVSLSEINTTTIPWTFENNMFDQASIPTLALTTDICSNNAYVTNTFGALTSPTNIGDIVLWSSPAYEVGTLGQNYYPTNALMIYAGSMTAAAAGLYHYTVTTNNVIDGNNMVSIGFPIVILGW